VGTGFIGFDTSVWKALRNNTDHLMSAAHFQADDEGSIPFTRSNVFKNLTAACHKVPTPVGCKVPTFVRILFGRRSIIRSRHASSDARQDLVAHVPDKKI
jgi:hypothetical protein